MDWKEVPTPDEIINVGKKKMSNFGRFTPWIIIGIFVLVGLKGIIYSIGPDELGVIQRFGKYIGLSSPGLHVKIPFGVDKVTPIKVEKIFKEEFGFRTYRNGFDIIRMGFKGVTILSLCAFMRGFLSISVVLSTGRGEHSHPETS